MKTAMHLEQNLRKALFSWVSCVKIAVLINFENYGLIKTAGGFGLMNIFQEIDTIKDTIWGDTNVFEPIRVKLIEEILTYIKSCRWSKDAIDSTIFLYHGKGLTSRQIAEIMDLNENTYRSRLSKISKRLKELLFYGQSPTQMCLGNDLEQVEKLYRHVKWLNYRFDLYAELEPSMLCRLRDATEYANCQAEELADEDIFKALLFVATYSKTTIEQRLEKINPDALKYVINEITAGEYTDMLSYYRMTQSRCGNVTVSPKFIEQCKKAGIGRN